MRIVLFITDLQPGGTPLRIARLALGLRELGVEVHVGCLAPPGPISAELDAAGIPTFACGARSILGLHALPRLALHLRRIKPDLIHSTLTHANVAARLAGFWTGVPVIGSTATIEVERRSHRRLERLTSGWERGHIVNSTVLRDHVVRTFGIPATRVFVVPPSVRRFKPVDRLAARAEFGLPPDAFVVTWVGRFDPVKRLPLLLEASEALREKQIRWLLVGDGPEKSRIEHQIRARGIDSLIVLPGWRPDLGSAFAAADLFAFPSLTEGMPNAVLEALAAGVPVLATRNLTLESLASGMSGIQLVENSAVNIAGAIDALRQSATALNDLRVAARTCAAKLTDPNATAKAVLEVYQRLLGPAPSTSEPLNPDV